MRHAFAAHDADRAAHLMELALPSIRRDRQDTVLIGWLRELPDETLRRSPVLSVFYGWMLMVSGDLDGVEPRLEDAERALAAVPDGSVPPWADNGELRTLPRPSPSTEPPWPRPAVTWSAPPSTPNGRWTWPDPTTTSPAAPVPGSSD